MAKKNAKDEKIFNYKSEIRRLRENGPERLYLLWGTEDYLRENYVGELRRACLGGEEDSFSYKRLDGPELDVTELQISLDAMPFMTERTFVELRGVDINKIKEPEKLTAALSDIPDYCTVVFVQSTDFEPDGRLKLIKSLRSLACELKFTPQSQTQLIDWIGRRFAAAGKGIELDAIQRLIFLSGDLMGALIPEIDKISAYVKGDRVTAADVDHIAHRIPEADVFEMTKCISSKEYNNAMFILNDLLSDKNNEPIGLVGLIGFQIRRLYAARLAIESGAGAKFLMESCGIKYEFMAKNLLSSARGFTLPALARAVELCAETDYRMKSSGEDSVQLLRGLVLRIAAGENNG